MSAIEILELNEYNSNLCKYRGYRVISVIINSDDDLFVALQYAGNSIKQILPNDQNLVGVVINHKEKTYWVATGRFLALGEDAKMYPYDPNDYLDNYDVAPEFLCTESEADALVQKNYGTKYLRQ